MRKKILLAEDDAFTRYMMEAVFNALGYEYDIASDGEECQKLILADPDIYGVVLMDLHMPNVSGVEAAQAIRAHPDTPLRDIPIIAVTAEDDHLDEDVIEANGMNGHLKKPIIASEVNAVVEQYCAG